MRDAFGNEVPWASAPELAEAVNNNLLTKEEARVVYWSQFPVLQRQASVTPPAIEAA